mgnify:FL=1
MKNEMESLISNQTWELAKFLVGKKTLHNIWACLVKDEHDNSKRYEGRVVK